MDDHKRKKRLDSFLYCCELETGGLFFGWFGIVGCLLGILVFTSLLVGLSQSLITDDSLQQMGFVADSDGTNQEQIQMVRNGKQKN
jgi:hypothetical protein